VNVIDHNESQTNGYDTVLDQLNMDGVSSRHNSFKTEREEFICGTTTWRRTSYITKGEVWSATRGHVQEARERDSSPPALRHSSSTEGQ
jgi:hypothetical protein